MRSFSQAIIGLTVVLGIFLGGNPQSVHAQAIPTPLPSRLPTFSNVPVPLVSPSNPAIPINGVKPNFKNQSTGIVCGDRFANIPGCGNDAISFDSVRTKFLPNFSIFQLAFTGLVAVVVVTVAGIFLVASLGDPGKKKKAMGMVYNALIAIFVAMLAYVIVQLVLGLDFAVTTSIPSALAQGTSHLIPSPPAGQGVNIPVGSDTQDLGYFVQAGLNVLFYVVGPIVVIAFFLIGIKLVMSEGKDDDFKKGMKAMGYAALGLSFIGLAYAVVRTALSIKF